MALGNYVLLVQVRMNRQGVEIDTRLYSELSRTNLTLETWIYKLYKPLIECFCVVLVQKVL